MPPTPKAIRTESLGSGPDVQVSLKLVVAKGPDLGAELALERGLYRVGTARENDLQLSDRSVSSTHLLVEVLENAVRVTDNQSRNGAFLQGMRFSTLEVKVGARVRIGRTELQVSPVRSAGVLRSEHRHFGALVGESGAMRELFGLLERVAKTEVDVLVCGETGTGKELCAEALHRASARAQGPFVICDLAGLAPSLIESELFGHVKGAFTGAHGERAGVFERAHRGTLFLDEVGELPLELQPRLLRALERRQVKRVGGNDYLTVDLRVVAATHRDLAAEAAAGRFRSDLFHRLAAVLVTLPPLRERPEDIPVLVDDLLAKLGADPARLTQETKEMLARYSWPGNVRELRNAVSRVVSLGVNPELPDAGRGSSAQGLGLPFKAAKDRLVRAFERDYLADLMRKCQGNLSRAAREAGIDRVYLRKLVKKHRLDPKAFR